MIINGNPNIISFSKKFDKLKKIALKYVHILVITETKLDDTFPMSQFLVSKFSVPYRLDRNRNEGETMIYTHHDIPSKLLVKHVLPSDIEGLFIELNFRKARWLLFGIYYPPSRSDAYTI